jgi:ribosome recycling factor
MTGEYMEALNSDMRAAIEALHNQLNTIRTGRASPKLLENVQVEVSSYGTTMPLNQLATISTPDPRLLVVTPWDKTTITDIERGITRAGLGLNPANDGQLIRVPIPALTGERRQELTRLVRKYGEDGKVRVRGVRREYNDLFRSLESDKDISKDELDRTLKLVQTSTDEHVAKVDGVVSAKEGEILEG